MPHASLKLIPGADRTRTEALNEAAIWDCNLIRFLPDRQGQGLPQKIGGWEIFFSTASASEAIRALQVWADNSSTKYIAIGTEAQAYTSTEKANFVRRSPEYYTTDIAVSLTTVSGSSTVSVSDTGSNTTSYDSIYLQTPISVGGLIMSGFYSINNPTLAANSYSITATNVIGVLQEATSSVVGGGAVPSFASTTGSLTITVTLNNHGYSVGSTFPILVTTIIGSATLYGNYIVTSLPVADPQNTFTITAPVDPAATTTVSMNGGKARITYFLGQNVVPPTGYGTSGYGSGGYGASVATAVGRTYTGVTITGPVGTTYTATLNAAVTIPVGSTAVIGAAGSKLNYTVTSSTYGATNSTFTFDAASAPTGGPSYSVTFSNIGFVMPDYGQSSTDWSLDNWGAYLIASPHNGGIFFWNPEDTSGQLLVIPNAPQVNEGCFVAMPERQIIAYGSSFSTIKDPMLVRWCDIANFTDWYATVVNQAGSYRIPTGSRIVGGMQGPQQGLLWTDISVWAMQYVNQPLVWSFNEVGNGCGLVGRKAMGSIGGTVYWMSQSQFFSLSGGGVQPVPCPIWDEVFQNIDSDYWENVRCAPNSRFSEISWFYPLLSNKGTALEGVPTNYVKYNTMLQQWDFGVLPRTAWTDQNIFGPPIAAGSEYNSGTGNTTYRVYQHEIGNTANGNVIDAYFQTGYFAIQEGDLKTFIDQVWPDMKWGSGTSEDAVIKITFYTADYPGDTPRAYVFDNIVKATQFFTPRLRARLVSIKVESNTNSGNADIFWRLGNIRYRFQPDGKF
jgi:hypothetical protein